MQRARFLVLNLIHFTIDAYASILGPLVAFVRMSPESIGVFGAIFAVSTSFTQLLFGYLADLRATYPFVVWGLAAAAGCLCLCGPAIDSDVAFASALILGGLGVAAFHPAGVVLAAESAGRRRALGVSMFVMAGTFGYGLGPVIYSEYLLRFGRERLPWLALPGLLLAGAGLAVLRRSPSARAGDGPLPDVDPGRDRLQRVASFVRTYGTAILPVYLLVVVRSMVQISLTTFLPTLLVARGHSETVGSLATTCFIGGGAVGMFVGGALTARYDRRWIQAASLTFGVPCALFFLLVDLPLPVGFALLVGAGGFTLGTNSMHIIMGQEIAPRHASTVSSLMMGVGWGLGGLGPALVGALSPELGVSGALAVVSGLPLATFPLILFLRGRPAVEEPGGDVTGELVKA